jgi:23S rRNA pseudouridine1911/1915/1917 synthase
MTHLPREPISTWLDRLRQAADGRGDRHPRGPPRRSAAQTAINFDRAVTQKLRTLGPDATSQVLAKDPDLLNALLRHVRDLSGVGGVLRPGIVHRLDRGTSGLLVVAKDDETHRSLARQFAGRSVEKEYEALVLGIPAAKAGTITTPIGRDPVHRRKMSIRAPRGREARSDYRVVAAFDGAAHLRVRIHTGRTHQIRVHLASIGHPVAGDATYGGTRTPSSRRAAAREALLSLRRPALHAARLAFVHPLTGERLSFTAPLPPDIMAVLASLRTASAGG